MSFKFIDKNRSEEYSHEILARCDSGMGIISLKICENILQEFYTGKDKKAPVKMVSVDFFNDSSLVPSNKKCLPWIVCGEEQINLFYNLLAENISNSGIIGNNGTVISLYKGKEEDYYIFCCPTIRDYKKFVKSGGKKERHMGWEIKLCKKEYKKFVKEVGAMLKNICTLTTATIDDLVESQSH